MTGEISCHWGHKVVNTSIRSLQRNLPTLENQVIWILVLTGARESVNSSIFLWLWYRCAGSLQVAYFSFASLHSNIDSWLQNTVIFLTAYLFYICRYEYFSWIMFASFSGISLWPFMEFSSETWFEIEPTSLFFLLFLHFYFCISCQHTLQLCLACQRQAAVPPSINLLIHIWFNFLPAGEVSPKKKKKPQDTSKRAKTQPRTQHLNQTAYKSTIYGYHGWRQLLCRGSSMVRKIGNQIYSRSITGCAKTEGLIPSYSQGSRSRRSPQCWESYLVLKCLGIAHN